MMFQVGEKVVHSLRGTLGCIYSINENSIIVRFSDGGIGQYLPDGRAEFGANYIRKLTKLDTALK